MEEKEGEIKGKRKKENCRMKNKEKHSKMEIENTYHLLRSYFPPPTNA